MPYVYVYGPGDFVGGLPDEGGGNADVSLPYVMTLGSAAAPTLVEFSDDNLMFEEVNHPQALTQDTTIDGITYPAGSLMSPAYDLINTASGHQVTAIHLVGNGNNTGPVQGLISTVELVPSDSYTFDVNRTSHRQDNPHSDYFNCFVAGTRIATAHGPKPVEHLAAGDLLKVADGDHRPLRLRLESFVDAGKLAATPRLRPIRIMAGALGLGLPERDLFVSPQHRMLVRSPIAERMFGTDEVLVAANKLTALPGIFVDETARAAHYHHLVLDDHEIVFADGAPTESLLLGPCALQALPRETRREIAYLFPKIWTPSRHPRSARPIPVGTLQKQLLSRHARNSKPALNRSSGARTPDFLPLWERAS